MSLGIWENINHLNFNEFVCVKKGFLRYEKGEMSLSRDKESQLLLKVIGDATVADFNFKDKEGDIPCEDFHVEFKHNHLDQKIKMLSIPINRKITQNNGKNIYIDTFLVEKFEFYDDHSLIGAEYLIEFVDNLKINYMFPNSMQIKENHEKIYEFNGSNFELIQKIINHDNWSKNNIRFEIEGDEIFIIKLGNGNKGLILYRTNFDSAKREKIRNTVSYILGSPLIFYGYTFVNKYMTPSYSFLKNINDNERNQLSINFQVPAPLSLNALNIIELDFFQKMIKEFFIKYDEYDLNNIFFTYWIAVNSNSITAAVHYGALIEKLQANYMKIINVSYSKILDKSIFKKLSEQLKVQLDSFELSDAHKEIFINKIGNMNTYSQKDMMNFFCKDISLELSEIEKKAWQQRNDAAHGNDVSDVNQAWKNTIILRELVNKLLLKLLTSSKHYFSYVDGNTEIKRL